MPNRAASEMHRIAQRTQHASTSPVGEAEVPSLVGTRWKYCNSAQVWTVVKDAGGVCVDLHDDEGKSCTSYARQTLNDKSLWTRLDSPPVGREPQVGDVWHYDGTPPINKPRDIVLKDAPTSRLNYWVAEDGGWFGLDSFAPRGDCTFVRPTPTTPTGVPAKVDHVHRWTTAPEWYRCSWGDGNRCSARAVTCCAGGRCYEGLDQDLTARCEAHREDVPPKPAPSKPTKAVREKVTYRPEALAFIAAGRGADYERLAFKLLNDEGVRVCQKYGELQHMYIASREKGVAKAGEPYVCPVDDFDLLPGVNDYGSRRPR